jgi:hypothetical protein
MSHIAGHRNGLEDLRQPRSDSPMIWQMTARGQDTQAHRDNTHRIW